MVLWSVELLEYDIMYEPGGPIKAYTLADFVDELVEDDLVDQTNIEGTWIPFVDGSSKLRGSGAGVTLEGPNGMLLEESLRFNFKAKNNHAEYEV